MRRKIRKAGLLFLAMFFLCGCSMVREYNQGTEKQRGQTGAASPESSKESLAVTFLDVGQGNAVLLGPVGTLCPD